METVFFNSDIARMVLGYLRKQRLDKAAEMFCKTSPFLEKEYEVLKQGYRLFGFKEDLLETIIREYCKITTKVDKVIESLPPSVRETLQQKNLSSRVSSLIQHHTNTPSSTVNENKENASAANKRKRTSNGSIDCDIQFANDDDSMLPPTMLSKRRRVSRNSFPNRPKQTNSKDFEILSQSEACDMDSGDEDGDIDESVHGFELPTTQSTSTPRLQNSNSSENFGISSVPLQDISQALLDNQEFQEKLVKNINKALQSSTCTATSNGEEKGSENYLVDELEEVVKNATEATEIDPIFDEFLKKVVSAQVYPNESPNRISEVEQHEEESQHPPQESLQPSSSAAPTIANNSTFGSLIDPNFSVSKLIVLNSNESAQKNHPSGDQVLASNSDGSQLVNTSTLDNQVYYDYSTGQLTCPLLLTSDGLLNLPFLINSDVIQQLQSDINLDTSRIEIPLPEPIILSVDQMPPNAVILRSAQKVEDPVKPIISSAAIGSNLDSKIAHSTAATPSTGILNARSFKSLSTPRKKSHVRTLSFSPMPPSRQILKRLAPAPAPAPPSVPAAAPEIPKETHTISEEQTIVKNVEILSQVETIPEADSENSNSVSNQTVIHKELTDTPKRNERSMRVKRVLSKDTEEDPETVQEPSVQAENEENQPSAGNEEKQSSKLFISEVQLNEWKNMREKTQTNFDTYLRQVNAKVTETEKRDPPTKKKRKNPSPDISTATITCKPKFKTRPKVVKEKMVTSRHTAIKAKTKTKSNINKKENTATTSKTTTRSKKKEDIISKSTYNIKITPQKIGSARKSKKRNSKGKANSKSPAKVNTSNEVETEEVEAPVVKPDELRERRMANIACLLDTPFKTFDEQPMVPPTPGLVSSTLETPLLKMGDPYRHVSDAKNSNIATPQFAITPGCTLTPFTKETPRSGAFQPATDYSSGGSYYRPDESDDLDKIIDKQLRDSTQKRKVEDMSNCTPNKLVDLVEQKIPCESVVLSRVKSFVDEMLPQSPGDLHYNLAAGLPEMTDEEEIPSSPMSTSSTSSSSSSSSSYSSGSSSSSSPSTVAKAKITSTSLAKIDNLSEISSTEDDDWSKDVPNDVAAVTEDASASNSQLVSNDGEVRYPVRSWLTPKKTDNSNAVAEDDYNKAISREKQLCDLELKKQRMKVKLSSDLKQPFRGVCVPRAIKAHTPKKTPIQTAKSKITTIRKQYVMSTVTTKEKKVMKVMTPLKITEVDIMDNSVPVPSNEQIEVLTALNLLSAKKKTPEGKNVKSSLPASSCSTKARKPQNLKTVAHKETTPSKPRTKAKPSAVKIAKKTMVSSRKVNKSSKTSPKRTAAPRQSSRRVRTPKALEDFSTTSTSSKKSNGIATPGPKRTIKSSPRNSTKIDSKSNKDIVLKPLVEPMEMKVEKIDTPREEEASQETGIISGSLKSSPETLKSVETVPNRNDSDDDDEDEADPYEMCERVLITESDSKRFIFAKYSGLDGAQPLVKGSPKKSHELNIYLNPNEKHCVKASDEFLLFSWNPEDNCSSTNQKNVVRNIPKKRQAKVTVCEQQEQQSTTAANNRGTAEEASSQDELKPKKDSSTEKISLRSEHFSPPLPITSTPTVPPLKLSELQKAAASRDKKKPEMPSSSAKTTTSRPKDDNKPSPFTRIHNQPQPAPQVTPSKPSPKESKSSSNPLQKNDHKSSTKSSKTKATANNDLKSTPPSEPAPSPSSSTTSNSIEAKSSHELPLDIDVILSKLHG